MPRVKNKVASRKRRKKILKSAKGYYGARSRLYRTAKEAVNRGLAYAYRDRRQRKRNFRRLWIARIGACARLFGLSYNVFINGLKKSGISLDRKSLAQIAVKDRKTFARLVEMAKEGKANNG